ncbi:GH1 family beta-glucosidase [Cellulomonas endophytica]|uniref:GH1 family beta-glucosidase n=1 Tax=Cellulomonas endophytica TaxID=2494735 RepID=UPI001013714F|nr:GH1 family beta-glucosidase [Cellulomonas endophytica]
MTTTEPAPRVLGAPRRTAPFTGAPLTGPQPRSTDELRFPPTFLWGAATAAYQIEGAAHEDGRRDSVWDAFARVPGAVLDGHDGEVACDHYHRYRDDVALMAELGLGSYRFSTSWARVRPDGGPVNRAGLDFYQRLVDELLGHGITPWLTLYHWDLPQALEERGGWASRDTAERFAEYALDVHAALGDRVTHWTTLNEPWCAAFLGYAAGVHAPGRQEPEAALAAAHHLLLGHGLAVQALREADPDLSLGITLNFTVPDPLDPADPRDVDAARVVDGQFNRIFLDPLLGRGYPEDVLDDLAGAGLRDALLDRVADGDLATIATPIDVLGVNYYHGEAISHRAPERTLQSDAPVGRAVSSPYVAAAGAHSVPRGLPVTDMDWEIQPEGLHRLLVRLHEDYTGPAGVALYVTENGCAFDDVPEADGSVQDTDRLDFFDGHLRAVHAAVEDGADVRGYFAWSLLDNYEWAWGYHKRFGLVRVDYDTQVRTVKSSGRWYAQVARADAVPSRSGD